MDSHWTDKFYEYNEETIDYCKKVDVKYYFFNQYRQTSSDIAFIFKEGVRGRIKVK